MQGLQSEILVLKQTLASAMHRSSSNPLELSLAGATTLMLPGSGNKSGATALPTPSLGGSGLDLQPEIRQRRSWVRLSKHATRHHSLPPLPLLPLAIALPASPKLHKTQPQRRAWAHFGDISPSPSSVQRRHQDAVFLASTAGKVLGIAAAPRPLSVSASVQAPRLGPVSFVPALIPTTNTWASHINAQTLW